MRDERQLRSRNDKEMRFLRINSLFIGANPLGTPNYRAPRNAPFGATRRLAATSITVSFLKCPLGCHESCGHWKGLKNVLTRLFCLDEMIRLKGGIVEASSCGHVADHICYTCHPSISVRMSITRLKCPIWPMSISSRFHYVPLRLYDAFRIGFLTHSHEQSFSSCQKYAQWDVTLSP